VDVEKNLQRPLQGITLAALEQGISCPTIRVGVRSGDTTPAERRQLITNPPPILITTPESLFLMLSSAAASILATVETIIVDEIHYLAGNKRGAHLAVSLERVEALQPPGRVQRIGLSATVRPPDRVAAFLSGRDRPTAIVAPRVEKNWDLQVAGATEDMSSVNGSIWPDVEQMIYNAITTHRSTICFSNSRAQAERLTNHLNTLHREANPHLAELVLARTHHGSIAKGLRIEIENELKAGVLPCVVATSSLELGIDMGAVDLVIQVGAPPSVASGLQRIGRGGHQVSAISKGLLIPLARSDLLATAVVTKRMAAGEIEAVHRISNPLDVLAQQIVSMCLDTPQTPEQIFAVITQADCFCDLPQPAFSETIDMLTGKYPSEDFTELRPRLIWDRAAGVLTARPGARRLVTTSGGTIPDRGLYPVFMVGDQAGGTFGKHAVSRRVGELDEEMVFESRVGEVFTLGTSSWRIEEINPNQVLVSPAFGQPGKLPFWLSDAPVSRSAAVGRDIGQFVAQGGTEQLSELDEWSKGNLQAYLTAQRDATGVLPDERTILVERHRDEMGAWRVCIHCQLGRAVLQPWAMAIMAEIRRANSHLRAPDLQAYVTDDGITIRLGEVEDPNLLAQLVFDADEIEQIVARETESSALFAAHFRQCAARALLLPRRDPGKRSPLWLQRLRSAQLLGVAASYPNFPIIAEALRECLDDVFDLANLKQLMRDIAARTIRIVEVETARPSPFAAALLFGYTGAFLYDADQPLAERANVASLVDADYLAALLGSGASQLLDETACAEVEARLQRLAPGRGAQTKEAFWDLLRQIGPLTEAECQARSNVDPTDWLADLRQAGRIIDLTIGSTTMVALSDDAAIFGSIGEADSLRRLVLRWVRHHGITTPEMIAARYALDPAIVRTCLESLRGEGLVERGIYSSLITGEQYLAVEVLARIRRRIITRLRAEVKPVAQARFASLVTRWQELDRPGEGREGLSAAVEQLAGYPIPYSMLESVVLPSRVKGYTPALLDQAMLDGEVYWSGQGSIGSGDGWICLWPADLAPLTLPRPLDDLAEPSRQRWERFALGGAWTMDDLTSEGSLASAVETAIWELVWAGWLSSDTLAP
ncbi:MAG: DEAD/DEAH box helicase, partial [Propionibacteriaceae bacterium]|nr:DEAD/DEAH box helicase [Propionibacteriaceae bacterium]